MLLPVLRSMDADLKNGGHIIRPSIITYLFSLALESAKSAAERSQLERRRVREEKRRIKQLDVKRKKAAEAIERRILLEEHKLLVAQRKLESVRLLTELFRRCQVRWN